MKNYVVRLWLILMLGFLWLVHLGCATSPPTRFYVLSPEIRTSEGKPSNDTRCVSLGIGPIKIPDYLDKPQIVSRSAPNVLTVAEFDRWAAHLGDHFSRVLAKNLSNQLCTENIVFFPWRGSIPVDYRIEVEVLHLDGTLGEKANLEAWWMIFSGDGKKMVLHKKSTFTEPVSGKDYHSLVVAQSRMVALLSGEIAEAIKSLPK